MTNPQRFVPLSVRESRVVTWMWLYLPERWLRYRLARRLARTLP